MFYFFTIPPTEQVIECEQGHCLVPFSDQPSRQLFRGQRRPSGVRSALPAPHPPVASPPLPQSQYPVSPVRSRPPPRGAPCPVLPADSPLTRSAPLPLRIRLCRFGKVPDGRGPPGTGGIVREKEFQWEKMPRESNEKFLFLKHYYDFPPVSSSFFRPLASICTNKI